jgi:hypothetical protein
MLYPLDGLFPLSIWSDLLGFFWLILVWIVSYEYSYTCLFLGSIFLNICFSPFTLSLCLSLPVRSISYRKQMILVVLFFNPIFWLENWNDYHTELLLKYMKYFLSFFFSLMLDSSLVGIKVSCLLQYYFHFGSFPSLCTRNSCCLQGALLLVVLAGSCLLHRSPSFCHQRWQSSKPRGILRMY